MTDQIETTRRAAEEGSGRMLVRLGAAAQPGNAGRTRMDAAYAAQLLGAVGQRRGLKGGAPVLDAARRAYQRTEWSGPGDRRGGPGGLALARI